MLLFLVVFVAFAHGSNDVANAVGPFAAILEFKQTGNYPILSLSLCLSSSGAFSLGTISTTANDGVPYWVLVMGGIGIVIGLAVLGYRVMLTVGEKITKLTHTRGFCAQLATATTVMLASYFGLPISTTHTLVGSITGRKAKGVGKQGR